MIKDRTGANAVPIVLPIGAEDKLEGIIDLVTMEEWVYLGEDLGASWERRPIRAALKAEADEWRLNLLETAVGQDDAAMEAYLDGIESTPEVLRALIRKGTLAIDFVPVMAGSSFKNKGVQPLLNAVIDYLPSPLDVPPYMGFAPGDETETRNIARSADDDQPFSALAFKIMNDPFVGSLTFTRIYSGKLAKGDAMLNATKERKERVGRMMMMHAIDREEITEAYAGDIIALAGLKETTTGDTLCDPQKPVVLETMTFPQPVIEIAVEPKTKADQEKMGIALARLAAEDPSFRVETDHESGQTIMKGMGELHLDILVDRMRREFKVEANVGKPQVAYRETIRASIESEGKHVKQSGGRGQYGHVWLKIEPNEPGKGNVFINGIVGGSVPREFIPAIDKGVKEACDTGVMAGYPVVDVKTTLFDGSYHDVDSDEISFRMAAIFGFKDGFRKAKPVILEPVMKVEVVTPEDYMGDVIGDLNRRRGQIQGMEDQAAGKTVTAEVPLSEMFGYATNVRSMSQGRATFTMEFSKYAEVPPNIAESIIRQ